MISKTRTRHRRVLIAWFLGSAAIVGVVVASTFSGRFALPDPTLPGADGQKSQHDAKATALTTPAWRDPPANFEQSEGHRRMLAKLVELHRQEHKTNMFLRDTELHRLREKLKQGLEGLSDGEQLQIHHTLGIEELHHGNDRMAIAQFESARQLFERGRLNLPPEETRAFFLDYALANLRYGESQNCCSRNGPENCILPIQGSGIHTDQEGSRRAIEILTQLLAVTPHEAKEYWDALWLLNIAHMTIDTYPDEVPTRFLIPPAAFESDEPFPRFPNIAGKVGLDLYGLAGAVIVDDFNNDGYLDLFISGYDLGTQVRIFLNNQDGTFAEHTQESGLLGIVGGSNLMQADYNNDGFVDVFLMRGGWVAIGGRQPISLIRNNGDGTFTDVTYEAGLGVELFPSQSGGFADYDNDGHLDLFVCGEFWGDRDVIKSDADTTESDFAPCRLFHNNGDGRFTDVAPEAGVANHRYAKGATWGDYDGDGLADLYVSNFAQPNRLYHNNGDGTFTDVAEELGVVRPFASFSCWFWDIDNDGQLDLYVAGYAAEPCDLSLSYMGLNRGTEPECLYHGQPGGRFEEVALQYMLGRPTAPMGANFGDLDNDGFLDFYLGTGKPAFVNLMPNLMFRNQEGKSFANVTTAGGFGNLQKGHGIAWADLDNDGDQDVFEQMGGAIRADKFYNSLYENPGFENHWVAIKLVGTRSNRSAIGARIRADIVEDGERRSVYKYVNSGGSFGANPLRQSIGLGKAEKIERLEIYWPTTGTTETFHDVPTNKFLRIVEGEGRYSETPLKSLRLGGSRG